MQTQQQELIGETKKWYGDYDSGYKYDKITEELKNYKIGEKQTVEKFNNYEKEVIYPVDGTSGAERFYVMALKDLDEEQHYWYYNAFENKSLDNIEANSVVDFKYSNGKVKTGEMIQKYKNGDYGVPYENESYTELWGLVTLKKKVEQGWFVPSRAEWSAFGDMLFTSKYLPEKVTTDNYNNYGLKVSYWASSQNSNYLAWSAHFYFDGGCVSYLYVHDITYVRLSATF